MQTTLPGDESRLQEAMTFLQGFWEHASLPPDLLFPFELSLEEVFMNVAMHGGREDGPATVWITLGTGGGRVELSVSDDGPAFDPLSLPAPDVNAPLEERGIGGLGVYLVREMMDGVSYAREGDRNTLRMWKPI